MSRTRLGSLLVSDVTLLSHPSKTNSVLGGQFLSAVYWESRTALVFWNLLDRSVVFYFLGWCRMLRHWHGESLVFSWLFWMLQSLKWVPWPTCQTHPFSYQIDTLFLDFQQPCRDSYGIGQSLPENLKQVCREWWQQSYFRSESIRCLTVWRVFLSSMADRLNL